MAMPNFPQVPVTDLQVGDLIDADDLYEWLSDHARKVSEIEYIEVEHHDNETPDCTVLGVVDDHYGIPADTLVQLVQRASEPNEEEA